MGVTNSSVITYEQWLQHKRLRERMPHPHHTLVHPPWLLTVRARHLLARMGNPTREQVAVLDPSSFMHWPHCGLITACELTAWSHPEWSEKQVMQAVRKRRIPNHQQQERHERRCD